MLQGGHCRLSRRKAGDHRYTMAKLVPVLIWKANCMLTNSVDQAKTIEKNKNISKC